VAVTRLENGIDESLVPVRKMRVHCENLYVPDAATPCNLDEGTVEIVIYK
jgi:hypothetical protein